MAYKTSGISSIRMIFGVGLLTVALTMIITLSPLARESVANDSTALGWPHEKSDLSPDPGLIFGKLDNGFRYVLLENRKPKNRVSMHLNVQAGSLHESDDQQGLAHFLEHMLFNGSTHFEPGELVKYFQSIGMEFGPDANARTGFDSTVYDIILPAGDRQSLSTGLLVMGDYAEGALLLDSEIERERNVILAEKRDRDSAAYRTFVSSMRFQFPEARLSGRFPIGIEEVLKTAGRKPLKNYYDTWYRPETMILVMVGDFDAGVAVPLIRERFAGLAPRAPPGQDPPIGEINHQGIRTFFHSEKEAGNTEVSIGVLRKVPRQHDSLALQRQALIKRMADRIVTDRLNTLVRRSDTPLTRASIGSGIFLHQIEYASISADCSPENWEASLSSIEQVLRRAILHGFTLTELDRVKKDFLAELDAAVATASTRDSSALARSIIAVLNQGRVFQSPQQEKDLFAPLIRDLTPKAVSDQFRKTWEPEHRLVMVTGNATTTGGDEKPEERIAAVFKKSLQVAVDPPVERKPVTFPYLPEPETGGKVAKQEVVPDLGITRIEFENGVHLNIKKTDFEADQVLVNLAFGKGRSMQSLQSPGLSDLTPVVIDESGLGSMDKDELDRAMAGKKTRVHLHIGEDRFVFRGRTLSQEVPLLFQLLYAHLVDPGFRENAFALSMERMGQRRQQLSRSIDGAVKLYGERFLAGGDSRFGLPSFEQFQQLTLDQVRAWIAGPLEQGHLEISVVGAVDESEVIALASRYFGSIPERRGFKAPKDCGGGPVFPTGRSLEVKVETTIPKGLVIVAYPTDDFWDIHRTRRLSVLASIFSDRLRVFIREKLGAAYSPYAYNRSSRAYSGYGVFQAVVHVDPGQTERIEAEVKQIGEDLAGHGVTPGELRRAIEPMLTGIRDMRRTNGYWLDSVLTGSSKHPQQLDWSRTVMEDYASITKEEVSSAARKHLTPVKAATFIAVPQEKE